MKLSVALIFLSVIFLGSPSWAGCGPPQCPWFPTQSSLPTNGSGPLALNLQGESSVGAQLNAPWMQDLHAVESGASVTSANAL